MFQKRSVVEYHILWITVRNRKLYIAGAADVAKISGMESPVLVGDIQLTNGLLDDSYTYKGLQGYAATDVTYGDHYYYTATGDNGVLARLNKITST